MSAHRSTVGVLSLTAILMLVAVVAAAPLVERVIYVTVVDRAGRPVNDVSAEQLSVLENDMPLEILRVSQAADPMDIAVLVDTSADAEWAVADIRQGLTEFIRGLGGRHQVTIVGFGQRPTVLVEYTSDLRKLEGGVARVMAQRGSGAYLLDAMVETARELSSREHARRQMVILTTEGREFSTRQASDVLDAVRRSGATVDTFVIPLGAPVASDPQLPDAAALQRAIVLTEAPRMTDGRRNDLVARMGLGERLRDFATGFAQYRVVFEGPPANVANVTEVLTTRSDLRVQIRRAN